MKTLFFLLALIFLFRPLPADAETILNTPHVVADKDVWLYATDGTRLFLIPASYYAPVTSMDDYFYYVAFNGVSGRVNKSEVSALGYHTAASGTLQELKIDSEYAEFSSINLLKSPDLGSAKVAEIPVSRSFTFLGKYPVDDDLWYAVRYEQYFGYVRASRTTVKDVAIPPFVPESPPVVEENSSGSDETVSVTSGATETVSRDGGEALKIVLIVGLIVPAVLVVLLLFRPIERKRR